LYITDAFIPRVLKTITRTQTCWTTLTP